MIATIYDQTTGLIWGVIQGTLYPEDIPTGHASIMGHYDGLTQYIDNGAPVDKQAVPYSVDKTTITADGVDAATLTGLPDCTCEFEGAETEVTDSTIVFSSEVAGTYLLTLRSPYHLDTELEVEAV